VVAVDTVPERLALAAQFGAQAVHLTEEDPKAAVRAASEGRGADLTIDAVGDPRALESAIRLTREAGRIQCVGVYAERAEVHMGLLWLKAITLRGGHANVIAHVDAVLALMNSGQLDPAPLVTHHMRLDEAAEAYALYDAREALKIVLTP
jgi:threonine dehydrogenase-like Zn-dependent dehydrogenase